MNEESKQIASEKRNDAEQRAFELVTVRGTFPHIADFVPLNEVYAFANAIAAPAQAPAVPEGWSLVPRYESADAVVSALYGRFKEWSKRGFGSEDVTWCEVKADIEAMIAGVHPPAQTQPVADAAPAEAINMIVRDVCELDGDYTDEDQVLRVSVYDLRQILDNRLYASPSPAQGDAPSQQAEPDMLWDASDTEVFANGAEEFANDYAHGNLSPGDISEVKVQCAARLPNRTLRIEYTRDENRTVKWEWVALPVKPSEVSSTGQEATRPLDVGKFYWVRVAHDPDTDNGWENEYMPARFAGYVDGRETWNFLDTEAEEWDCRSIEAISAKPSESA